MKVPLEILRMILEHFVGPTLDIGTISARRRHRQILPLRYVDTTFAEEVLSIVFSRLGPTQADKLLYASWPSTPPSLREKYLYYQTFKHRADNRLFTSLFNPVFERQVARLSIQTFNRFARHEKLTEWCRYFMHERWGLGWVVTQCRLGHVKNLDDYYHEECQEEAKQERRIENDHKFLEICCAIVNDDEDAVLQEFVGFYSGVDDLNYCFGTTLLGFALKWGSLEMLKLLLRSVRSTPQAHFFTYLEIAMSRTCGNGSAMTKTLLDHFSGFDTRKKSFTINMLSTIVSAKDKVKFDVVISWFATVNNFPGKLGVMEWLCKRMGALDSTYDLLTYPSPTPHISSLIEISHIIPACQLSLAYEHYLESLFLPAHPMVKPYSDRGIADGNEQKPIVITPPTALFQAASRGLLHWVDWLLWASADARHEEGEISLLDFAWKARKRREVATLLYDHGWDLEKLELKLG